MKREAQDIMRTLHQLMGKDKLRILQERHGGVRWTIPTINTVADTARDLEILAAWREKPAGTLSEFYREQSHEHGCHTKTVARALKRMLKKAS